MASLRSAAERARTRRRRPHTATDKRVVLLVARGNLIERGNSYRAEPFWYCDQETFQSV